MERMASSGLHRGLTCSCPGVSILGFGRGLGMVSLIGAQDGRTLMSPGVHHRQQGKMWQSRFVTLCSNPLKVSQRDGESNWAHVCSQQSHLSECVNGKGRDSALRWLHVAHERRQQQQQAVLRQALQVPTVSPSTTGEENLVTSSEVIRPDLLQGTKEWLDLRKNRITASSFGNALGFWGARRVELWEEKIGIREPFAGNEATRWGSSEEANAIEKYKEITGNSVGHIAFKIYHDGDDHLSWLGASPDGLISYINGEGEQDEKLGILEVKCPHNKGKPELGRPWDSVPYYYMPQAQGLLEIFDRQHMDFYVWTMNGSSVFRIERNPEYWGLIYRMMAEFWWGHVIPAKCALEQGKSSADIQAFKPVEDLVSTERIVSMSRHLARHSRLIWSERGGQIRQF